MTYEAERRTIKPSGKTAGGRPVNTAAGKRVAKNTQLQRTQNKAPAVAKPRIQLTEHVETVKEAPHTQLPVGVIFFTLIATLLLMFMVYMNVQINEYTTSVSTLNSEIAALKTKERELTSEVIKKEDLVYIEEYATKKLGMVKEENLPQKYVSVGSEDKAEIVDREGESGGYGSLSTLLSAIGENLQAFLSYMRD